MFVLPLAEFVRVLGDGEEGLGLLPGHPGSLAQRDDQDKARAIYLEEVGIFSPWALPLCRLGL